jgi:hypothetical protein
LISVWQAKQIDPILLGPILFSANAESTVTVYIASRSTSLSEPAGDHYDAVGRQDEALESSIYPASPPPHVHADPGGAFGLPRLLRLEVAAWELAALGDATDEGLAAMRVSNPA